MTKKKKINNIVLICIACLLIGVVVYKFGTERNKNKLLENARSHFAIVTKIKQGSFRIGPSGKFKFVIKKKTYEFTQSGNFKFMKIGDTVLIEYSVQDPSTARVIDKYYMQKYKNAKSD